MFEVKVRYITQTDRGHQFNVMYYIFILLSNEEIVMLNNVTISCVNHSLLILLYFKMN